MKTKRKGKKAVITVLVLLLIAAAVFAAIKLRPQSSGYTEEVAKSGDITTYYSFSGSIEAKDRSLTAAPGAMQIRNVYFVEGDRVEKDDVIVRTKQGQKIKAKISGQLSDLFVEEEDTLMMGDPIFEIVDYDNLQVAIKVDEYDIGTIALGKKVTVIVAALDKEISGTITDISKEATTLNDISYFTATVALEPDPTLLLGLSTEVRMINKSVSDVTTLSMKALQFDNENKPFIYRYDAQGEVIEQPLTLGINDGTSVEITSGISAGDTVLIPVSTDVNPFMPNIMRKQAQ